MPLAPSAIRFLGATSRDLYGVATDRRPSQLPLHRRRSITPGLPGRADAAGMRTSRDRTHTEACTRAAAFALSSWSTTSWSGAWRRSASRSA